MRVDCGVLDVAGEADADQPSLRRGTASLRRELRIPDRVERRNQRFRIVTRVYTYVPSGR